MANHRWNKRCTVVVNVMGMGTDCERLNVAGSAWVNVVNNIVSKWTQSKKHKNHIFRVKSGSKMAQKKVKSIDLVDVIMGHLQGGISRKLMSRKSHS